MLELNQILMAILNCNIVDIKYNDRVLAPVLPMPQYNISLFEFGCRIYDEVTESWDDGDCMVKRLVVTGSVLSVYSNFLFYYLMSN